MEGFFTMAELEQYSGRPKAGELSPKCGACGLYKTCKTPKMRPWGKGSLGILVVGEAPEELEDIKGRPFAGPSGDFLRDAISRIGADFDDLLITNSIICRPPGNKMPQKGKEVAYCRPNLVKTIEESKPRVVITLGRNALETVINPYWRAELGVMERWTGHRIPLEKHWVCPTWHPSHLLRQQNTMMDRMFMGHLFAALAIQDPPPVLPNFEDRIEKLYDESEIVKALQGFDRPGSSFAFDYETNCLKPEYPKARIWSCAVSDGQRTVAYPFFGKAVRATSILLRSNLTRKIAANLKFEERWTLKHLGHPVTNWDWDTMLATHAIDNRPAVCSLKFQAFVQLGVPTYNDYHVEQYLKTAPNSHYNRIHEAELGLVLRYNGMDALLEHRLARRQQRDFGGSFSIWRKP
jgi:uracil-DNA glycosylase family 4